MKEIRIYVEGADAHGAQQKADLRRGLDQFLGKIKDAARQKRLGWTLTPCGSRRETFDAFRNALKHSRDDALVVLLVDSEAPLTPELIAPRDGAEDDVRYRNALARVEHLRRRDGWDLDAARAEQVHLMVQYMESWLVADPSGLAVYYKKNFHPDRLPARPDIENEPKTSVYGKLASATRETQKGEYSGSNQSKTKHAPKILQCISADVVAARCPRFATFVEWLTDRITRA